MLDRIVHCFQTRVVNFSLFFAFLTTPAVAQWPEFGGPNRNFVVQDASVNPQWSEGKPTQLWKRALGEGYSGIAVDHGQLFTMYRDGDEEVVIALDAETGETLWQYKYPAPAPKGVIGQFGHGPNATPLVNRTSVYTLGGYGHVHCFSRIDGKVLWSHDLVKRLGLKPAGFAYSASPIMYKDRILMTLGSEGGEVASGVVCFYYRTGMLLWAKQNFEPVNASPIIINVDGQDQLVVVEPTSVVGIDPLSGRRYWDVPFQNEQKTNCATPVWDPKSAILVVSSAYGKGSVAWRLQRDDTGATRVNEIWHNQKIQVHHGSIVGIGGYIFASSGSFGPEFLSAMNLHTGKIAYRQRGFAKANVIFGDGKLIVLDEDGKLAIADASPTGFNPIAQAQVLEKTAWTAPTLTGDRLYLRDKKNIVALEIGAPTLPGGRKTSNRESK